MNILAFYFLFCFYGFHRLLIGWWQDVLKIFPFVKHHIKHQHCALESLYHLQLMVLELFPLCLFKLSRQPGWGMREHIFFCIVEVLGHHFYLTNEGVDEFDPSVCVSFFASSAIAIACALI